jgi:hypothetical protein
VLDLIVSLVGLVSVVCLAVPAWHINKYGRLLARLSPTKTDYADQAVQQMREQARAALQHLQIRWTAWKSNLLVAGTLLAGASYVIAVVKAAAEYFFRP